MVVSGAVLADVGPFRTTFGRLWATFGPRPSGAEVGPTLLDYGPTFVDWELRPVSTTMVVPRTLIGASAMVALARSGANTTLLAEEQRMPTNQAKKLRARMHGAAMTTSVCRWNGKPCLVHGRIAAEVECASGSAADEQERRRAVTMWRSFSTGLRDPKHKRPRQADPPRARKVLRSFAAGRPGTSHRC